VFFDDASGFLGAADPFLRSDPFSANVIAVIAAQVAAGSGPDGQDCLWATSGPTNTSNPDGGLANARHQMSDPRYQAAGGDPFP
jgi:hypothetical protein